MWQSLRLASLGVISEASLELEQGLTVITGETGAGKTMVITALALLRGERANASMIRTGMPQARIEAAIKTSDPSLLTLVQEAGGDADDELLLARVLSSNGRSRAVAGGATVPAGLLSKLTDRLVAVHGQSDQQRLVHVDQQRLALDQFAGAALSECLALYQPSWERLQALRTHRDEWQANSVQRLQRLDTLKFGLEEIATVDPRSGEDQELRLMEDKLAHAELLAAAAFSASNQLADADISVSSLLSEASHQLQSSSEHDPQLETLSARINELRIDAEDIASELHSYSSGIDIDPQRLATVQERRAELAILQRKYGPQLADVLSWAKDAAEEVARLDLGDMGLEEMDKEIGELESQVQELANSLTEMRIKAAMELAEAIEAELADLALEKARVRIDVEQQALASYGQDRIRFMFSANSGAELQPIGQGASGGELSRLMLAIEVVLIDERPVPTLVFDEVDAGIGGRTAIEVGRKLARLANSAQVIVVTHLPQVAAFADHHFVVTKNDDGDVTNSSVVSLDHAQRVEELARMLSGTESSEIALAHARELLETSR